MWWLIIFDTAILLAIFLICNRLDGYRPNGRADFLLLPVASFTMLGIYVALTVLLSNAIAPFKDNEFRIANHILTALVGLAIISLAVFIVIRRVKIRQIISRR